MFSDEATFHVSGKVDKQSVLILRSEHPHAISGAHYVETAPKLMCGVACCMII
jgi:hypothetical protein